MAAILNLLLILMSAIRGDCTIVLPTLQNAGFGVGIASISQLMAKLQALSVYSICYGRHLEFSANIDITY